MTEDFLFKSNKSEVMMTLSNTEPSKSRPDMDENYFHDKNGHIKLPVVPVGPLALQHDAVQLPLRFSDALINGPQFPPAFKEFFSLIVLLHEVTKRCQLTDRTSSSISYSLT